LINDDSTGQSSLSTHDVPARYRGWSKMMVCRSKLTVSLLNTCLILVKELMSLGVKSHLLHGFQNREASLSNNVAC
jgi:hypothetical protein